MSAYVVENKTINNFLSYLSLSQNMESTKRELLNIFGLKEIPGYEKIAMETLGLEMMKMNCRAVNERYKDLKGNLEYIKNYKYNFDLNVTRFIALKSLSCWLYQCGEGTILGSKEYKIFELIKGEMAMKIVRSLKEYDLAEID